jgi:uncharacterized membrane protein YkvA (DUF1232 family)
MTILGTFTTLCFLATAITISFLVLLSLPQSKLRAVCLEIGGWLMAALCAAYVCVPTDILPEALLGPFGLPDDLLAVASGIYAAKTAWQSGKDKKQFAAN